MLNYCVAVADFDASPDLDGDDDLYGATVVHLNDFVADDVTLNLVSLV